MSEPTSPSADVETRPDPPKPGLRTLWAIAPRKVRWLAGGVLTIALLGVLGTAVATYAAVTHYEDWASATQRSIERRDTIAELETKLAQAESAVLPQERVANRESAVSARENAVEARETALAATEQRIKENSFSGGVLVVGRDVAPGTYRTAELRDSCYYAWKDGTGSDADIVDNNIASSGTATATLVDGEVFESRGCGTWTRIP